MIYNRVNVIHITSRRANYHNCKSDIEFNGTKSLREFHKFFSFFKARKEKKNLYVLMKNRDQFNDRSFSLKNLFSIPQQKKIHLLKA
jgi:uncharacterized protein (DUF1919 family)